MSCQALLNQMGYECREVEGRTIAVDTPFTFPDGEVISFYVREADAGRLILHDNADTLMHLKGVGLEFPDRKGEWRAIKNIVEARGFTLQDSGTITAHALQGGQPQLIASYIGAILAVADFEREKFGLTEEQADYIAQVEFYLRAWKPNATFERAPAAKGHSGKDYRFHFRLEEQLVDAARPHGRSTGAILRKSVDVRNAGDDRKILVVMDDREDTERAKQETDILTTMVSVLPFTVLVRNSEGRIQ